MKKTTSRRNLPRLDARAAEDAASGGDADERRSLAALGRRDENAFVEFIDVEDDYLRGVDALTRRLGWAAFQ